ncbi:MAG: lytic transglycosylase domain-containing protein [Desulfobacca sp.]|uniref:lytic transglycosylase domain-containing protein n=1 Tax=Desulfobacca sp. TaxID=2067990 RepID=UPI00404A89FD
MKTTLMPCFRLLYLLLGLAVLLAPPASWAESYRRVVKNGVIYYYFANRPTPQEKSAAALASGRIRIPPAATRAARPAPATLETVIQAASRQHKLPPALIKAVIRVESNFDPTATSPKGAQGLMQLMPQTAAALQVQDPYDLRDNVMAGSRYLRLLLEKFGFQLPLALAAYNAGPQRVAKSQQVPPIPETQAFVRDVCHSYLTYERQ